MDTVETTLPVTRAAADRLLREPAERVRLGALVSLAAEGLIGPRGMAERSRWPRRIWSSAKRNCGTPSKRCGGRPRRPGSRPRRSRRNWPPGNGKGPGGVGLPPPLLMLDASSLVRAALAPGSAAGLLLAAALGGRARLAGSPETLQEAARVLVRPKFAARLSPEAREASIARLVAATEVVESVERVTECRDPSDDMVLEAALALLGGGQG